MTLPFFPDYQLANPWWLLLFLALPLLAWLRGRKGHAPTLLFPTAGLIEDIGTTSRSRRGGFHMNLLFLAMVPAIIAMARPQKVISTEEIKSEGIAICVAFDVSLSMLIEDYYEGSHAINRISAAKKVLSDFIKGRPADRIGIVAFAGAPYFPCPPTLDHDWLLKNMDRIQTGVMEDGTAIGSGIATAARHLDQMDAKSKVIVLITDGANNSGKLSPLDAAHLATALHIRIYTIGLGTPGEHPIHLPNGQWINSGRDEFDENSLKQIAEIGHGMFFKGTDSAALERVFREINEMEKTDLQHRVIVHADDLFDYFLIPAVALFALFLLWKATVARTAPATA